MSHYGLTKVILVVDDHPEIRALLREILETRGYLVLEACNGLDALCQAGKYQCDLVITDLLMPEKEGIETIRALRALQPALKIMAVSGATEFCYLKAALLLGANDAMRKPFDPDLLIEAVDHLVNPMPS